MRSYAAGIVGKAVEMLGAIPSWFWWTSLGIVFLCLVIWIWNYIWRKMGPDEKPLFATVTYALIAFAGLCGLAVWLVLLWQSS